MKKLFKYIVVIVFILTLSNFYSCRPKRGVVPCPHFDSRINLSDFKHETVPCPHFR